VDWLKILPVVFAKSKDENHVDLLELVLRLAAVWKVQGRAQATPRGTIWKTLRLYHNV
jgi:hypothetical protein